MFNLAMLIGCTAFICWKNKYNTLRTPDMYGSLYSGGAEGKRGGVAVENKLMCYLCRHLGECLNGERHSAMRNQVGLTPL